MEKYLKQNEGEGSCTRRKKMVAIQSGLGAERKGKSGKWAVKRKEVGIEKVIF